MSMAERKTMTRAVKNPVKRKLTRAEKRNRRRDTGGKGRRETPHRAADHSPITDVPGRDLQGYGKEIQ